MKVYEKTKLDQHYQWIFEQNREKIMQGGVGDSHLLFSEADTRMSIALLIRIGSEVSGKIKEFLDEMKSIEPELYYYPKEDFHITVMDILRGMPGREVPENVEEYVECVKECAKQIDPFYIEFNGVTASDNALMIKGYYEYELEKFRQLLRANLKEKGLVLEERYQTFSAHITAVRVPEKLRVPETFIEAVQKERCFGVMKVEAMELVYHNWYDSKKEVLAKIIL